MSTTSANDAAASAAASAAAFAAAAAAGLAMPLRLDLETRPDRIASLPLYRGYPVPWFVAWHDHAGNLVAARTPEAVPEFRCMDGMKWRAAVEERLCWVCGERLGVWLTFVLGPMCGINRISNEPPCHHDCAVWSARNCPFLSRPNMTRRTNDLPEDRYTPGVAIERNPGVTLLWVTKGYRFEHVGAAAPVGNPGTLIRVGPASRVEWYAEGRAATRAECLHSIETGLPALIDIARRQEAAEPGCAALRSLMAGREALEKLLPRA